MAAHRTLLNALAIGGALLWGCAARPSDTAAPADHQGEASILVNSQPAAGSSVAAPVDQLILHFNPPARVDEVTVAGPDGLMPMMVTSVGEARDYSLPVHGLGPGSYTVSWRATTQGREYRGTFQFTVR
jgi:methionine-rich copper-binding protein CopC